MELGFCVNTLLLIFSLTPEPVLVEDWGMLFF